MSASDAAVLPPPPKDIHVGGHKIHFRFLQTRAWVLIMGIAGVCFVSGVYYALTQVHWFWWPGHSLFYLKPGWDHLVHRTWWTDGTWRHGVRNIGEGLVALLLGLKALSASWKKHYSERLGGFDVFMRFIASLVLGMAIILASLWVVTFGVAMIRHGSLSVNYVKPAGKYIEYAYIAIGVAVGFVVTFLTWKPAGRMIQRYLAEFSASWWYRHNRMPLWIRLPLTSPELRERTVYLFTWQGAGERARGLWITYVFPFAVVVFLGFLGTGVFARWFA